MTTTSNNDTEKRGFAGLTSLISDISQDIADATHCPKCGHISEENVKECQKCGIIYSKYTEPKLEKGSFVSPASPHEATCSNPLCTGILNPLGYCEECGNFADEIDSDNENTRSKPQQFGDSGNNTGIKWLFGIGCVIVFFWVIGQLGTENKSSTPAPSPATSWTYTDSTSTPPETSTPPVTPNKPKVRTSTTRPKEDKPPVGRNHILSYAQIRYCLSEKIRLDVMEGLVNTYFDQEVDLFNAYVDDYNSRCRKYRYRKGVLQNVREKVEVDRWSIEKEGRQRVVSWREVMSQQPVQKKIQLDRMVLDIQKRLTELGYNPGIADGLMGRKTIEAIKAFQRDNNIQIDGEANNNLLQKLNRKNIKSSLKSYVTQYKDIAVSQEQLTNLSRYEDLINYFSSFSFFRPKHKVNSDFIRSLILAGSDLESDKKISRHSFGVTKLSFGAAKEAADELVRKNIKFRYVHTAILQHLHPKDLDDPAVNILLACYVIAKYNYQYKGKMDLVVSAFYAGEDSIKNSRPAQSSEVLNHIGKVNGYFIYFLKLKQKKKM